MSRLTCELLQLRVADEQVRKRDQGPKPDETLFDDSEPAPLSIARYARDKASVIIPLAISLLHVLATEHHPLLPPPCHSTERTGTDRVRTLVPYVPARPTQKLGVMSPTPTQVRGTPGTRLIAPAGHFRLRNGQGVDPQLLGVL
jgi:hypothetical protein